MAISVTPLHPVFGAEVRGVDLTSPVPAAVFAEIEAAFNRYSVLVFPKQPLTDEQQIAFSRLFGPLETSPICALRTMRCRRRRSSFSKVWSLSTASTTRAACTGGR